MHVVRSAECACSELGMLSVHVVECAYVVTSADHAESLPTSCDKVGADVAPLEISSSFQT